jgi:phosphate transport system protein
LSSHYQDRLQRDLDWIQELVGVVGSQLIQTIQRAVIAVLKTDHQLAAEIIIGDYTINRQTRELDRLCHVFVARHLPTAGHLRFVSSVLRLNITLERIGDYTATISRTAAQLTTKPPAAISRDIEMMAEQARRTLNDALKSFQDRDVQGAKSTAKAAAQFAPYFDRVFEDLAKEGDLKSRPTKDLLALMATLNRLERIIHQAKNVCEETIFVVTGDAKGEKKFRIIFLDDSNSGASQLAEHFTRKAFPNSGTYTSAGYSPGDVIDAEYREFADSVGMDLSKAWPTDFGTMNEQLESYDLIIGLKSSVQERLPKLPFHTTALMWDIAPTGSPEETYRQMTPLIRDLMQRLRGDQAS